MSTTIEDSPPLLAEPGPARTNGTDTRNHAALLLLVLLVWALILLALPFVGPAGRQVAVVGGAARSLNAIRAAGGQVVEMREGAILARSDRPGFALALYRAGAPLVLEGRIGASCFTTKPGR